MDPHTQFCHNPQCPATGQAGQGNIVIHCRREARYRCTVCRRTFSARTGTPFFRRQVPEDAQTRILTLVAHGCPVEAAAVAFGYQPRTIRDWVQAAGAHCAWVQATLVEQPHALGQVQADEVRVRCQASSASVVSANPVRAKRAGGRLRRSQAISRPPAVRAPRCRCSLARRVSARPRPVARGRRRALRGATRATGRRWHW